MGHFRQVWLSLSLSIDEKGMERPLVGPDEFEPKQPQLGPFRKVVDPEALKNARPDRVEPLDVYVGVPLVISPNLLPVQAFTQVGTVTVIT